MSIATTTVVRKLRPWSEERFWQLFTGLLLLLVVMAALRWMLVHPYGIHWDEALYFNGVLRDIHSLYSGSLRKLGSIVIGGDVRRPPANLLLALPFVALFGFHTALVRFVTLACWGISGSLIYLTSRRLGSPAAGTLAVVIFCLSPEVISASIFFSTEGPFFLATAMMLYFVSFYWTGEPERMRNWIGLGIAIGLGLLSKTTFALVAIPALAASFFLSRRNHPNIPAMSSFIKAGGLAFLIAAPWWLKNLRPALSYVMYAQGADGFSLGKPSPVMFAKWLAAVFVCMFGPLLSILISLVIVMVIREIMLRRKLSLDIAQRTALLACSCAVFPLVTMQLSGTNHLLRLLSPLMIPFAIAFGILADATGWIRSKRAMVISAILAVAQVMMIVAPVVFPNDHPVDPGFLIVGQLPWRIMVRFDQWDWKPLREITQNCGLERPRISYLGLGRTLNPPQLLYPWFLAGTPPSEKDGFAEPFFLWRSERRTETGQEPLDWQKITTLAEQSDVVVTAPGYVGEATERGDLQNRYNRELSERLTRDPHFRGPIQLQMGRFEHVEVTVFLKNARACHTLAEAKVNP